MNCVVNRFECSRYTNSQQHGCADFGVTTFRLTIVKKETVLQLLEMLLLMSSIIHNYLLKGGGVKRNSEIALNFVFYNWLRKNWHRSINHFPPVFLTLQDIDATLQHLCLTKMPSRLVTAEGCGCVNAKSGFMISTGGALGLLLI